MLPIDPVEIVWLNYFTGPRFRSILGGAIERYGRDQVAAAMTAYVRSIDPNVISIAAASNWAGDIVSSHPKGRSDNATVSLGGSVEAHVLPRPVGLPYARLPAKGTRSLGELQPQSGHGTSHELSGS